MLRLWFHTGCDEGLSLRLRVRHGWRLPVSQVQVRLWLWEDGHVRLRGGEGYSSVLPAAGEAFPGP